jgi:hypothetical protein
VDDPFWDELCHECQHDEFHDDAHFEVSCGSCIAEAEQHYEDGLRWNGKRWVDPFETAMSDAMEATRQALVDGDSKRGRA